MKLIYKKINKTIVVTLRVYFRWVSAPGDRSDDDLISEAENERTSSRTNKKLNKHVFVICIDIDNIRLITFKFVRQHQTDNFF